MIIEIKLISLNIKLTLFKWKRNLLCLFNVQVQNNY